MFPSVTEMKKTDSFNTDIPRMNVGLNLSPSEFLAQEMYFC